MSSLFLLCLHVVCHVVLFGDVVVEAMGDVVKLVLRKATDEALVLHLSRQRFLLVSELTKCIDDQT